MPRLGNAGSDTGLHPSMPAICILSIPLYVNLHILHPCLFICILLCLLCLSVPSPRPSTLNCTSYTHVCSSASFHVSVVYLYPLHAPLCSSDHLHTFHPCLCSSAPHQTIRIQLLNLHKTLFCFPTLLKHSRTRNIIRRLPIYLNQRAI